MPTLLTAADWVQLQAIFDAAIELPPEQRSAFLDSACQTHSGLRTQVESLLESFAGNLEMGSQMGSAIGAAAEDALAATLPSVGGHLGPYRITSVLGRGGMGIVYRATRDDDEYKKDVAIKAVGFGLFAPELRRRFLAERQILANLDHPNIARLLDGGTTPDGLPYVVMEYVQGQPIDRYCLEKDLSQRDRLLLAIEVIQAVDYAHRHLVVHRDLKPDNIFVDINGTPKLLDFGIAKALDPNENGLSLTQTVERVMTPDYASPEQILGQSITTSTDVFQLGVLLYVLLAGRLPFHASNGRIGELERLICEAAPPKTGLPPDLDRIVLQALEKDPGRRYLSAAALSEDLQSYLDGFPVKARATSWRYSAWKFVQRHKIAVSAANLAVLGLIGVSIAMTVIARRASQQARIADQTTDFLLGIFGANDPVEGRGDKTTARELLDNAAAELQTHPNQDPIVEVQLLDSIGESYRRLGDSEQAKELLVKCLRIRKDKLPGDQVSIGDTLTRVANAESDLSHFQQAINYGRQAVDVYRRALGENDTRVAAAMMNLGGNLWELNQLAEAEKYQLKAVEINSRLKGRHDLSTMDILNDLALTYDRQGKLVEEEALFREILDTEQQQLRPGHPQLAYTWTNLGWTLQELGQFQEAEKAMRNALAIRISAYPKDHWILASSRTSLAMILLYRGKAAEAADLAQQAKETDIKAYGVVHKETALAQDALAGAFLAQGKPDDALVELNTALKSRRSLLAADHPNVIKNLLYLAQTNYVSRDLATAQQQVELALSTLRPHLGENNDRAALAPLLIVQAQILAGRHSYAAAEKSANEAIEASRQLLPAGRHIFAAAEATLGWIYSMEPKSPGGLSLLRDALAIDRETYGPDLPQTAQTAIRLAASLWEMGQKQDAERIVSTYKKTLLDSRDPTYRWEKEWLRARVHLDAKN